MKNLLNIKNDMYNESTRSNDLLLDSTNTAISLVADHEIRSLLTSNIDTCADAAIMMHSIDKSGQDKANSFGVQIQLRPNLNQSSSIDAINELETIGSYLTDMASASASVGEKLRPIANISNRAFNALKDLTSAAVDHLTSLKDGEGDVAMLSPLQLNTIDATIIGKLPNSLKSSLSQLFTTDSIPDEVFFNNAGEFSTKLQTVDFNNAETSAAGHTSANSSLTMPLQYVQNFYKMMTFLVQTPIVTRPTPWTSDLVQRMVMSSAMIRESALIKLVEFNDTFVTIDEGPPSIDRAVAVLSKLKNYTTENSQANELSSHTMRIDLEDFKKPIERLNYERVIQITHHNFKLKMEQVIREFVLGAMDPTTVASGDVDITTGGTNPIPGVLPLTGVNVDGERNQTINELDLRKVLDGLNNHVGGTMITHMLIHPKALLTICDSFREVGYWPRNIDGNAKLLSQPLNSINPSIYTTGAGVGNPEMSQRDPGLFGPNMSAYSAGMGETIPEIINAMAPSTSSFNLESAFYHKFTITVGNINLSVVPNVDAKLYRRVGGTDWVDNTALAYEIPMLAVQGDMFTDILLINANRTCLYMTTGIMQKSMISLNDYTSTMNVALHEEYRLVLKNRIECFQISKVRIEADFSHRALVIRKS